MVTVDELHSMEEVNKAQGGSRASPGIIQPGVLWAPLPCHEALRAKGCVCAYNGSATFHTQFILFISTWVLGIKLRQNEPSPQPQLLELAL